MDWKDFIIEKYYITDIGEPPKGLPIKRYGVWDKDGNVIDTSNDVEALKKKYNVSNVVRTKR